jgi:hypothetical protein
MDQEDDFKEGGQYSAVKIPVGIVNPTDLR